MKHWLIALVAAILFVLLPKMQLWAEVDLEIVWQRFPGMKVENAKWSADGRYIYCAVGNQIHKMDASNGDWVSELDNTTTPWITQILSMSISASGKYIAAGSDDKGGICLWDTELEKIIDVIKLPDQKENQVISEALSFLPDNKNIVLILITNLTKPPDLPKRTRELIQYDFIEKKVIRRQPFDAGAIQQLEMSHDGRFFVTGSIYKDIFNSSHSTIILWDAQTFEQVAVLEDMASGDGYSHIKFSKNDRYLAVTAPKLSYEAYIFDLTTNQIIKKIDKDCFNIDILPDNIHSLIFLGDFQNWYELQLHNFEGKIKSYQLDDHIIESWGTPESWKVFYGGDRGLIYLLTNKLVGVKEVSKPDSIFNIIVDNGNLILKFSQDISISSANVSIYDISGKIIYNEAIEQIPADSIVKLKVNLISGVYICKLTFGNNEYTQKFEVMR